MKRLFFIGVVLAFTCSLAGGVQAGPNKTQSLHSWDLKIDDATRRFKVLERFNNEAVLDMETGLVWERSPDPGSRTWVAAKDFCYLKVLGGRGGWRLPTIEELASLIDQSHSRPALPGNHPFMNIQSDTMLSSVYWSDTTRAALTSQGHAVYFFNGGVGWLAKTSPAYTWCVRGGKGNDGGH